MALGVRLVASSLVVSFLAAGPLASIARAQQPAPPAPAQPVQGPAATAPVVPQPDLFEEALKRGQPVSPAPPTSYQPAETGQMMQPVERTGLPYPFYQVMAGLATVFLIPGKIATCTLGLAVGTGLIGASLGSGYQWGTEVAEEGCGGKWILTGDDLVPGRAPRVLPSTERP